MPKHPLRRLQMVKKLGTYLTIWGIKSIYKEQDKRELFVKPNTFKDKFEHNFSNYRCTI